MKTLLPHSSSMVDSVTFKIHVPVQINVMMISRNSLPFLTGLNHLFLSAADWFHPLHDMLVDALSPPIRDSFLLGNNVK